MAATCTPKIHTTDATPEQRVMYEMTCQTLATEPLSAAPVPVAERVELACRATLADRRLLIMVAGNLGLRRNAAMVMALRLGLGAMVEAVDEMNGGSGN